jgi:hypothetical protein
MKLKPNKIKLYQDWLLHRNSLIQGHLYQNQNKNQRQKEKNRLRQSIKKQTLTLIKRVKTFIFEESFKQRLLKRKESKDNSKLKRKKNKSLLLNQK